VKQHAASRSDGPGLVDSDDIADLLVSPDISIRDAMVRINASGKGILLAVGRDRRLITTITDGDIRRAILAGISLDSSLTNMFSQREGSLDPVTARPGTDNALLLQLMKENNLRHVPMTGEDHVPVGLALLSDLMQISELKLGAVVMAGGHGTRLRPLTNETPKPMLPVGNRPLLEDTIDHIRAAGIRHVHLTTHYKPEVIRRYFKNGHDFGVDITYTDEAQPLGTAGALGNLPDVNDRLLVINGDILTRLNFRAMMEFHEDHRADITMVVREYTVKVPYGVVTTGEDGISVSSITEKPTLRQFVNAGIYLLNQGVSRLLARGERCDMPELIERALAAGRKAVCFPVSEYWLDIGSKSDYEKAQADYRAGRV
jgi:dTDP-glucose pyrophosphorylase/CBS domain-containing protein